MEQLLSAPAVQFKGSGWYVTDYARKGTSGSSESKSGSSSEKDGGGSKSTEKSDSKKTETKSESKPKK